MAGAGGGAWKVAYADFVTAMMAFFMVMWITAQGQDVKEAVAEYFQHPPSDSLMNGGGSPLLRPNKPGEPVGSSLAPSTPGAEPESPPPHKPTGSSGEDSSDKKPKASRGKDPDMLMIHAGDRRRVGTVIVFGQGKSDLDAKAKDQLLEVCNELRGKPQKVEIRGHAARGLPSADGDGKDPWQVSYARCQSAMNYLVEHGIAPERIRLSQGGAYEPFSIESDPSQRMYNSRVEVYVLNELTEDFMGTPEERAKHFSEY